MVAEYRFVDRWAIPAPIEDVYGVLEDVNGYPRWWRGVYLRAEGDPPPAEPGKRNHVITRGYLPYRLDWSMRCVAAERPRLLQIAAEGDFEGGGTWSLRAADGGTLAVLDWRPRVNKPIVRALTPVLRPLFRSNHGWAMRRGERQLTALLADRNPARP